MYENEKKMYQNIHTGKTIRVDHVERVSNGKSFILVYVFEDGERRSAEILAQHWRIKE